MTIQILRGEKVERIYVGWRWVLHWPTAMAAAKRGSAHGQATVLRGLFTLEEW